MTKSLAPPDRAAQLERIQVEIDRATEAFVKRILLLTQQRKTLLTTRTPTGPAPRLVRTWEKTRKS